MFHVLGTWGHQDYKNVSQQRIVDRNTMKIIVKLFFFSTGFYSPYLRTLAFLNGLLDPQTFGRTPWLGDQSNARSEG
jgi:hypothetical protein